MEFDLNKQLELHDTGTYFIPKNTLMRMSSSELREAENLIQSLVEAHPDFAFYTHEEVLGGITISWERHAS